MKIAINISKELVEWINGYFDFIKAFNGPKIGALVEAIKNGTPISEGHGDLIDVNEIKKHYPLEKDGLDLRGNNQCLHTAMDDAPTIIEADAESETT